MSVRMFAASAGVAALVFWFAAPRPGVQRLTTISWQAPLPPAEPALLPVVSARADALEAAPVSGALAPQRPATLDDALVAWARLNGTPVRAEVDAPDQLSMVACRFSTGAGVWLSNRTDSRLPTHLRLRLPAGDYAVERVLTPVSTQGAVPGPIVAQRLQGAVLPAAAEIEKRVTLAPGQAVVYRFLNETAVMRAAVAQLDANLRALAGISPGAARRIRNILGEARPYLRQDFAHRDSEPAKRLRRIHQALLVLAQAQALHRNFLDRGAVTDPHGQAAMDALDQLERGAAETSGVLLDLVPRITINRSAAASAGPTAAEGCDITVSLLNAGQRSVSLVKLGLDLSRLVAGTRYDPADPALFQSVAPGQTVSAVFHVSRVPEHCAADVSYYTTGSPAHLRPEAW